MATKASLGVQWAKPVCGRPLAFAPPRSKTPANIPAHMLASGRPQLDHDPRTPSQGNPHSAQAEYLSERTARDEQLIVAVARGDQQAFATIYDRYAPMVFGLALNMLHDRETAEEAVQEVFWRVWQRARSFDRNRSFAPWLFSIAHNYYIDELRRWRTRPQLVYEDAEHPVLSAIPEDTDVGELALQAECHRIVVQALQELPVKQRQVLKLVYFGGLTHQEIAKIVDHPPGTVKTRLRLGLQKLRTLLQGQGLIEE